MRGGARARLNDGPFGGRGFVGDDGADLFHRRVRRRVLAFVGADFHDHQAALLGARARPHRRESHHCRAVLAAAELSTAPPPPVDVVPAAVAVAVDGRAAEVREES